MPEKKSARRVRKLSDPRKGPKNLIEGCSEKTKPHYTIFIYK